MSAKIAAIVLGVVLLQIAGGSAADSKLVGKYTFNGDPDDAKMDKVLAAAGLKDDERKVVHSVAKHATKEISISGDEVTMTCGVPIKQVTNKFTSGKEVDEETPIGPKIKTTATVEGDKITFKRKLSNGKELVEVLECNAEGCVSKLSIDKEEAEAKWKRV